VSVPLAIFNRNQGEIARTRYAMTQAQQLQAAARGQVLTDVRDAYEALETSYQIAQYYRSGYLEVSKRSRDISEYAIIAARKPAGLSRCRTQLSRDAIGVASGGCGISNRTRAVARCGGNPESAMIHHSSRRLSNVAQSDPMTREEVRARIAEVGIIPAVHVYSESEALFAAAAVSGGGIPS